MKHVLPVDGDRHPTPNTLDLTQRSLPSPTNSRSWRSRAEDLAVLHFIAEGPEPRNAMHVHEAVLTHYVSSRYALDLHSEDI